MKIRITDYPQISLTAWNRLYGDDVDEVEALAMYECNWSPFFQLVWRCAERILTGPYLG